MKKQIIICLGAIYLGLSAYAQQSDSDKDQQFINEVENAHPTDKVLHAEPLFIDLIRDLGARKGEKEWNLGFGLTDKLNYDSYHSLIEYEWAPINRLGFEIEMPFTFYAPLHETSRDSIPANKVNLLKLATQWSFYVNEKQALSMALGYIHELRLFTLASSEHHSSLANESLSPFAVIAKRWGNNFHTLLYTGPVFEPEHRHQYLQVNSNFHYMISGTRNFVGVEFNQQFRPNDFDMTIRPQMRVGIADNLLVGIVVGIPVERENERISSFIRLIWEPKHH